MCCDYGAGNCGEICYFGEVSGFVGIAALWVCGGLFLGGLGVLVVVFKLILGCVCVMWCFSLGVGSSDGSGWVPKGEFVGCEFWLCVGLV